MATYRRDLTEGGTYFFTLALQDRSKDWLTRYINELRAAFIETQQRYPFKTIAICILPDHLHWLMELPENDHHYATRIRLLKTLFSQKIPDIAECQIKANEDEEILVFGNAVFGNISSVTSKTSQTIGIIFIITLSNMATSPLLKIGHIHHFTVM